MTVRTISLGALRAIARSAGGGEVSDEAGVEAVINRPFSGVVDQELFPTIWTKAAALLHGFATTQYFDDGNKRTAWVVARTFLSLNGCDLGVTETIHAEAMVLAAAANYLDVEKIAEWLQVTFESSRGDIVDRRLEYLFLARAANIDDTKATMSILGAGMSGVLAQSDGEPVFPAAMPMTVCGRVQWSERDDGANHTIAVELVAGEGGEPPIGSTVSSQGALVVPSELAQHRHGRIPTLLHLDLLPVLMGPGRYEARVTIDGELAGIRSFYFEHVDAGSSL